MKQNNYKDEQEAKETENWRNEHGEPDFNYLQSLGKEGSSESIDKLKSIADDLNADYDPDASAEDLIETIRMAAQENEDGNVNDIN
jgi:hypothetical protein